MTKAGLRQPMRRGMTLAELMISIALMVMIAGAMSVLSSSVQSVAEHTQGMDLAAQHGRVAISRIESNLRKVYANENFPGCIVVATTVGSNSFPDVLVMWKPETAAANPTGMPLVKELVVYAPDANSPNQLLEITWPSSGATAPAISNGTSWASLINNFQTSSSGPIRSVLTDMVRTNPSIVNGSSLRGAVRFQVFMAPTLAEMTAYRAGSLAWSNINWPQDQRGSQTGTRIVACQTELQLLPVTGDLNNGAGLGVVPFFGSGSFSYFLAK